jgi:cytochrome c-type biogenesis protein CcmH
LQAGRRRAALDRWLALERDAPDDARWLATLRPRIERLARELGLDLAALRRSHPSAPAEPAPGPTADDVESASQMTAADRQTMIESMVARLAARLKDSPDDAEGWLRLARSYGVLGEAAKARDAFARAATLRPDDVAVQVGYANSIVRATPSDAPPPAAFAAVVTRIRAIDPDNPDGLWLAGVVALGDGRKADALRLWRQLLASLPPGSPAHAALAERIAGLQGE